MTTEEMLLKLLEEQQKTNERVEKIGEHLEKLENKVEYMDQKINLTNSKLDDVRVDVKYSQKLVQKDINKLKDAQDTVIAVLEHRGILKSVN